MQVKVPTGFQRRWAHCAAAFHLNPALAEVTIFGGYSDSKFDINSLLAHTTVLTFGEFTVCVHVCAC